MALKTVLEYTQACLSTMDSDNVDDIADTVEAGQVANLLKDTYYELINRQEWEFLNGPISLVAAVDVADRTRFTVANTLRHLKALWYNVSNSGGTERRKLHYLEPVDFLDRFSGAEGDNKQLVSLGSQLQFYVYTDRMPYFYTTFDDQSVHCEAVDLTIESTLQTQKVSAYGVAIPAFQVTNVFVPTLPEHMIPLLQASLNSAAHLYFKQQESAVDTARERRQLARARMENSKVAARESYYANQFGR